MSLTLIAIILLTGFLLISVEVFLVPGTTVVGISGLVVLGIGVYLAFHYHGLQVGGGILLGSGLLVGVFTSIGLKRISKGKFSVHEAIDGKVNEFDYTGIEIGDEGLALTALRPEGRAMIKDKRVIVYSKGFYIDSDTNVVVVKIKDNKIFVEPKK